MNNQHGGGAFPAPEQEWLLRAALLSGETALQAWQSWRALVDWEQQLDAGSYRLLPLLYSNLQRLGVDDPVMGRLKGIYRQAWYKNQLLFHDIAEVLRLFQAAGIETMILKGAALTRLHYKDYGLRPMNDFDVLVPTAERRGAMDVLTEAGWRPLLRSREKLTDAVLDVQHAWGFENTRGRQFDLHWHVLWDCRYPNADDDFWTSAVPVQVGDVSTLALNPTDQLLHVCVHGVAWNPVPPVRWIADAMTILNDSHSPVDWTRLAAQAQKRRLTLPLRETLSYLCHCFGAPIPSRVLNEVGQARVSDLEFKYYHAITTEPDWLGILPACWYRHMRDLEAAGTTNSARKYVGFPRYLQRALVMDRRQLLAWLITRAIVRTGNKVYGDQQHWEQAPQTN